MSELPSSTLLISFPPPQMNNSAISKLAKLEVEFVVFLANESLAQSFTLFYSYIGHFSVQRLSHWVCMCSSLETEQDENEQMLLQKENYCLQLLGQD